VVVHRGTGPNSGHYLCYVLSESNWLLFNDDVIELVDIEHIQACFGAASEASGGGNHTGYILFYQKVY